MAAPNYKKNPGLVRMLNGEVVQAVLYNGRAKGHGKYFTGSVKDNLILDENNKPLPFSKIGELVGK